MQISIKMTSSAGIGHVFCRMSVKVKCLSGNVSAKVYGCLTSSIRTFRPRFKPDVGLVHLLIFAESEGAVYNPHVCTLVFLLPFVFSRLFSGSQNDL